MVNGDPQIAVGVLAPCPGFVHFADIAILIFGIHPSHRGGCVAIQPNHCIFGPCFRPGAALFGDWIRLVAECKTGIIKLLVASNEVRHRSIPSSAECCIAVGPGGYKGHSSCLVVIGRVNDIAGEFLGGFEAFSFVDLLIVGEQGINADLA